MLLASCSSDGGGAEPSHGDAFEEVPALSCSSALKPGSFSAFGLVYMRNTSPDPVRLVGAAPVLTSDVEVTNLAVVPGGPQVPGCIRDEHVVGARDIGGTVIPPSQGENDQIFVITFETALLPDRPSGVVVGMDVRYEQGGDIVVQRWPMAALICEWLGDDPLAPSCGSHKGVDVMNLRFEEVLERFTS